MTTPEFVLPALRAVTRKADFLQPRAAYLFLRRPNGVSCAGTSSPLPSSRTNDAKGDGKCDVLVVASCKIPDKSSFSRNEQPSLHHKHKNILLPSTERDYQNGDSFVIMSPLSRQMILKRPHESRSDHTSLETSGDTNDGSQVSHSEIGNGKLLKLNDEADDGKVSDGEKRLSSKIRKGNVYSLLQLSKFPQEKRVDDDENTIHHAGTMLTVKGKDASENATPFISNSRGDSYKSFCKQNKLHSQIYKGVTMTSTNNKNRNIQGLFTQESHHLITRPSRKNTFHDVPDEQSISTTYKNEAQKFMSRSTISLHHITDDVYGHVYKTSNVQKENRREKHLDQREASLTNQWTKHNVRDGKNSLPFYPQSKEENQGTQITSYAIQKEGSYENNGDQLTIQRQRAALQSEDADNANMRSLEAAFNADGSSATSDPKLSASQHQVHRVLSENEGAEAVQQTRSEVRINKGVVFQESSSQNQHGRSIDRRDTHQGFTILKLVPRHREEKILEQQLENSSPVNVPKNSGSGKTEIIEDVEDLNGYEENIGGKLRSLANTQRAESSETGQVVAEGGSRHIPESQSTFQPEDDGSNLEGEVVSNVLPAVKLNANKIETELEKKSSNQLEGVPMTRMEIKGEQENEEYDIKHVSLMPISYSSEINKDKITFPQEMESKINHHPTETSVERNEDGKIHANKQVESKAVVQLHSMSPEKLLQNSIENEDVTTVLKKVKLRKDNRRFPARVTPTLVSEYHSGDVDGGATAQLASGNRGIEPHGSVITTEPHGSNKGQKDFSSESHYDPSVPVRFTKRSRIDPDEIHGNRDKNAVTSGAKKHNIWDGEVEALRIKNRRSLFGIISKPSRSVDTASSDPIDSYTTSATDREKEASRNNYNEDKVLYSDSGTKNELKIVGKNKESSFLNPSTASLEGISKVQLPNAEKSSGFSVDETSAQLFPKTSNKIVQDSFKIPNIDIESSDNDSGESRSVEDTSESTAVEDSRDRFTEREQDLALSNSHRGQGKETSKISRTPGDLSTRNDCDGESPRKPFCRTGKRGHKCSSCHVTVILEYPKQIADAAVSTDGTLINSSAEGKSERKGVLPREIPSICENKHHTSANKTLHKTQEPQVANEPIGSGGEEVPDKEGEDVGVARRCQRALQISGTGQDSGGHQNNLPRPAAANGPCELLSIPESARDLPDAGDDRTKQQNELHQDQEDEDMENTPLPRNPPQGNRSFGAGVLAMALRLPAARQRAVATVFSSAPTSRPSATPTPLFASTNRMLNT